MQDPCCFAPFDGAVSALGDGRSTLMQDRCPEDIDSLDGDRVSTLGLGILSPM